MMHRGLLSRNLSTHWLRGSIQHSAMIFKIFQGIDHLCCFLRHDTVQSVDGNQRFEATFCLLHVHLNLGSLLPMLQSRMLHQSFCFIHECLVICCGCLTVYSN